MATILVIFLIQNLPVVTSNSFFNPWNNLHLNFKGMENCVFKIKRFSDAQDWVDISESLLHPQNRINYLFYSVNDTALSFQGLEKDFRFFEPCSINFILKYDNRIDSNRRVNYIFSQRDTYRGPMFANWIIVTKLMFTWEFTPTHDEYLLPHRLLFWFVSIKKSTDSFTYFCPYCHTRTVPILNTVRLFDLNPLQFKDDWKNIAFLIYNAMPGDYTIDPYCAIGLRTRESLTCDFDERFVSSMSQSLNITFVHLINADDLQLPQNKYGYYEEWVENPNPNYKELRMYSFVQSPARFLGYCDYNVRAENFSFLVWLNPFHLPVWILLDFSCAVIVFISCIKVFRAVYRKSFFT